MCYICKVNTVDFLLFFPQYFTVTVDCFQQLSDYRLEISHIISVLGCRYTEVFRELFCKLL